jgi:hypothetical protein
MLNLHNNRDFTQHVNRDFTQHVNRDLTQHVNRDLAQHVNRDLAIQEVIVLTIKRGKKNGNTRRKTCRIIRDT